MLPLLLIKWIGEGIARLRVIGSSANATRVACKGLNTVTSKDVSLPWVKLWMQEDMKIEYCS